MLKGAKEKKSPDQDQAALSGGNVQVQAATNGGSVQVQAAKTDISDLSAGGDSGGGAGLVLSMPQLPWRDQARTEVCHNLEKKKLPWRGQARVKVCHNLGKKSTWRGNWQTIN